MKTMTFQEFQSYLAQPDFTREIVSAPAPVRTSSGNFVSHVVKFACGHDYYPKLLAFKLDVFTGEFTETHGQCEKCAKATIDKAKIPELAKNAIYTRNRMGLISFYRADPTSPTGVMLIGSVSATKENDAMICAIRPSLSPLSPTEGLASHRQY